MPMHPAFRLATPDDRKGLLQLLSDRQSEANATYNEIGNQVPAYGGDIFDEMISNKSVLVIVGVLDERIIATLTIYILPRIRLGGYFALFEDVLVTKSMRSRGIGTELLKYAVAFCKNDSRIKKIKLGSRKNETGIHSFYRRAGFMDKEILFQQTT